MRISDWSSDVCSSDLCGSRAASDETWTKRLIPAARAARTAARVPAILPVWKPALSGALTTPAMCSTTSASAISLCRQSRSEEHTSELQSLMRISYAVFCLKKKKKTINRETSEESYRGQRTHTIVINKKNI